MHTAVPAAALRNPASVYNLSVNKWSGIIRIPRILKKSAAEIFAADLQMAVREGLRKSVSEKALITS
jgi:hypothetical protein